MKNLTFKTAMLKGSQPTVNRRSTDGQSQRHCKQTPLSKRWKVLMTLVFLFTMGIGQMWADDFSAEDISTSGTTSGHVTCKSTAGSSSGNSCTEAGGSYASSVTVSKITSDGLNNYIEIHAADGYKLTSPVSVTGVVDNNSDKAIVVCYWEGDYDNTNGFVKHDVIATWPNRKTACAGTTVELSFTGTVRTIRLYRKVYVNSTTKLLGTSSTGGYTQLGSGTNLNVSAISASATAMSTCTKPGTPANLAVSSKSHNSVTIGWNDAANADGYKVYVEKKSDASKVSDWTTCATNSYTATGLNEETEYTFKVKAVGASGYCELGDEATIDVTTEEAPAVTPACPSGLTISGTNAYTEGETIELTAALTAGNGEISYQWYKGSIAAGNEVGTNSNELTIASCEAEDAGNYFCVASKDGCAEDAESSAYAVTVVDAPAPCFSFVPDAKDESVTVEGSSITTCTGGTMVWSKGGSDKSTLAYDATYGLLFGGSGSCNVIVTLNHLMQENTEITATIVVDTKNTDARGLLLRDGTNSTNRATWTWVPEANKEEKKFTYKVKSGDGLIGTNVFRIFRSTNAYIKSLTVSNCGAELHALTSAIDPVAAEGKATVTLSKTLIAAGGTATATYSAIDAAYDFDEWVVSGATIDDAKANPVTITMGSTDAVITLKLKAASVKHTVTYYDGATELGTEQVEEGSNPTGAGLTPKKQGYTFGGWSLTNGGDAIASYASVTVDENKDLFAVWTPVVCPTSGTVFAFEMNESAKPGSEVKAPQKDILVIDEYLTITGQGSAIIGNTTNNTNQYASVKTDPKISLSGATGYLQIALECALQAGDVITIAKNNTQIYISDEVGTSGPTGNKYTTATNAENTIVVGANETTAAWVGAMNLYFWYKGGGVNITSVSVTRPAKHTLAWNFDGGNTTSTTHTAAGQVVEGAAITYPANNTMSKDGYTFSGWSTDVTEMPTSDLTITALWTAWPTMTLNRGAATSGDDVVTSVEPGSVVTVPACPFSYTDYNFNGWAYSPAVTMVDETHFTMPSENLTLTAQWVDANNVAQIGSTKYATLEAALADATNGTIELLQDIDVTAQVEIAAGVTATIDLAGHKIEYTGDATLPSGVLLVHNGASLTVNDSSDPDAGSIVSGNKAYAAIALTMAGDDASAPATLTINGGNLYGYYYAITGNGSRHNTVTTINNVTITTSDEGLGIFHPQEGTLTINNATITGHDAAIEMRAGTLVIYDGTFTATATAYSINPNGSGSTTVGAALAIAQHTTKKPVSVTINGGIFNGVRAINEANPQGNSDPEIALAVKDGEFTGAVETVDVNNYISGGTFSNALADAQCATDYYPATKPNGKYGVTVAALSVNFVDEANAETPTAWATFLNNNHYDYNLGDGGEISWDKANAYDTGLKLKKSTNNAIYFTTEPGKLIELTVGNIAGMTIQINGGTAQTITGGTNNDNLGVSYYYSDNAQAVVLKETSGNSGYNMLKSINIRDPYTVSFDANGGDAVASLTATPAINLPSATNGTQNFAGWYDALDNFIGNAGAPYTPTANIELVAHWEALSTVNTLSDLKVNGVTVDGFDPEVHTYNIVVPYGTAIADLPKITAATATNANATVNIYPSAGPEWTDDFGGCYRQQANVTPQDPNAAVGYNDIRITIGPKDMLCIIKAEHDGTATGATISGFYGGSKDKDTYNNGKLGEDKKYFGIKLDPDAGTFKAGDVLKIYATNPSAAVRIYSDKGTTRINPTDGTFDAEKMFTYTLTEDEEWIYLYRRYKETETDMNPTLGYMAVYRSVPNPLVETITFNGAVATVDNDLKTITVEVPATTDLATMPVLANFYSNDPNLTSGAVTGSWAEGDNEYIVTDKDGDQSVYTVIISKAVPSSDATLSALSYGTPATAIALADGVYEYNVTLPYGTTDVPALAATPNHAGASITAIEDAAAFVNRHATSTVTVKAEDDATTQTYTVNFTVDRYETTVLWDASVNDNLSQLTGCTTAGISVSDADDVEFEGKTYGKKALSFGGKTKSDRYLGIQIPNGKVAKVSIVYKSRGTSARSIMLATTLASAIDEQTIVSATAETQVLARMTADIFAGGTIYINTTDGFYVYEIDVQLAEGYGRSAMLGAGVYGTVCVDHNVAVEDIQGVSVYELMGREPEYGKLAFDEIVSGELEAGVPYVFQAHGNHMAMLYGATKVDEPVDKHNGMYGTFVDKTLTELDDVYYFAQRALWSCVDLTSLSVPANRAYVKLSEIDYLPANNQPAPGRRRVTMAVNGEKVATGMGEIEASETPMKVMIDGQLFIIRGEKMFDATGRLVK